jgi:MerR family transcriptional regulator, redox-sensitive transcriptional activator SoxR
MRISEVARRASVLPTTIRFYESIGLLPPAHRVNGQRVYGPDVLDRLTLVRFGLKTGFSLKELKVLFSGFDSRVKRRAIAKRKIAELRTQRVRLEVLEKLLAQLRLCSCGTIRQVAERLLESDFREKSTSRK